MLLKLFELEFH